jgi:hypothetical protein
LDPAFHPVSLSTIGLSKSPFLEALAAPLPGKAGIHSGENVMFGGALKDIVQFCSLTTLGCARRSAYDNSLCKLVLPTCSDGFEFDKALIDVNAVLTLKEEGLSDSKVQMKMIENSPVVLEITNNPQIFRLGKFFCLL